VFYFNGNLKHAADDLYNKALKAFFSVKSKKKTCLKLFDSLLKPISLSILDILFSVENQHFEFS
jgi:hypothetical protein